MPVFSLIARTFSNLSRYLISRATSGWNDVQNLRRGPWIVSQGKLPEFLRTDSVFRVLGTDTHDVEVDLGEGLLGSLSKDFVGRHVVRVMERNVVQCEELPEVLALSIGCIYIVFECAPSE